MPWVRFDDQFSVHRKVTGLSDAAFRLHVSAIFWCARNLTDGVVPEEDLEDVCARVRSPKRFVAEMVKRGAWHEIGTECDSEDCPAHPSNATSNGVTEGWVIHDYLEYQPSKERVTRERKDNAERQKKWREKQKRQVKPKKPRNAVSNGSSNSVSNSAPSRPVPSRRDELQVGGDVQEVSQSARAREREATRWLIDRYRLTDQEALRVIEIARARAPEPVKALVPYLKRMAEHGDLADIVAAVMPPEPPPPAPETEPATAPEPTPEPQPEPANQPPPPPRPAQARDYDAYDRGPALARQLMAERRRANAAQNGTDPGTEP